MVGSDILKEGIKESIAVFVDDWFAIIILLKYNYYVKVDTRILETSLASSLPRFSVPSISHILYAMESRMAQISQWCPLCPKVKGGAVAWDPRSQPALGSKARRSGKDSLRVRAGTRVYINLYYTRSVAPISAEMGRAGPFNP